MAKVSRDSVNSRRLPRRRFLQCTLAAGGAGLTLPQIVALRSLAAETGRTAPDTAVIQIWLGGGPSQFETFDPKPGAPPEVRGPYDAISTRFAGIHFCETMPRMATLVDRTALIRTVSHPNNNHFEAAHWCSTGYAGQNNKASHPSSGSLASKFHGPNAPELPAYVLISEKQTRNPEIGEVMGTGHLGNRHGPFTILQDPFSDQFQTRPLEEATANLRLADDVTLDRIGDREFLLAGLDRLKRQADASSAMRGTEQFARIALDMVTSGKARRAFDLTEESDATRAMYGRHRWGQMALLARRLVEAGTTFVTLSTAPDSLCWDWHLNIVDDKRPADGSLGPSRGMNVSGPPLDQMLAALVTDLYDRGLDRRVLLVVWGEFGRTPRINPTGGRDHWGSLMSILVAGGGLRMGQVIGSSNRTGEFPSDRPVHPTEVLATIYRHLGIEPSLNTDTPAGRPIPVLSEGRPLVELL